MTEEYFRWAESTWVSPDIDWKKGDLITAGCDVGSTSSQLVILVDGELYAYSSQRSKGKSELSAQVALEKALEGTDGMTLDNIEYIVGTGYGRVLVPFATRDITEISCHARGANFLYGDKVRTILDMGGQDLKVISCNEKGKVMNFIMNDKCAAGAGRGIETMAEIMKINIEKVGDLAAEYNGDLPDITPECVVFAKTDALRRLKEGWSKESILAAYCAATSWRVAELLGKVGVEKEFCITGGIAKNKGVVKALQERLKIQALKPEFDTQIAGAAGAALYGKALAERARG
jgi:bzd-type benzoyl-CoA reductase Q subunit